MASELAPGQPAADANAAALATVPAPATAVEEAVDLNVHPSGIVPTLQYAPRPREFVVTRKNGHQIPSPDLGSLALEKTLISPPSTAGTSSRPLTWTASST
tara:strand:+ start:1938 stop:2240 length:303 start_codon:yes stop_codon:yes gene_type:complete